MSKIVLPNTRELADLVAKLLVADWIAAKMHLFSVELMPSELTVLADLTEVVATGVTAQSVTYGTPYMDSHGIPVVSGGELTFTQTGATPDLAWGCFLTNTAGTKLLFAAKFDVPFGFNIAGDTLQLTFKMALDGGIVQVSEVP